MVSLDLRKRSEGMECEEYTLLVIAGPYRKDMPLEVRERMNQHEKACSYHQSLTLHQSALGCPVTETLKKAAMDIVKNYARKEEE